MCLGKVLWYYPSIYYTLHSFKPTHTPHMLCGPPQSFVVFFGLCVRFLLTNRIHEIDAVYSFQISRDIQQVYVNTRQYRKTFYFHIMLHEEILHEKENPNKIKGHIQVLVDISYRSNFNMFQKYYCHIIQMQRILP